MTPEEMNDRRTLLRMKKKELAVSKNREKRQRRKENTDWLGILSEKEDLCRTTTRDFPDSHSRC